MTKIFCQEFSLSQLASRRSKSHCECYLQNFTVGSGIRPAFSTQSRLRLSLYGQFFPTFIHYKSLTKCCSAFQKPNHFSSLKSQQYIHHVRSTCHRFPRRYLHRRVNCPCCTPGRRRGYLHPRAHPSKPSHFHDEPRSGIQPSYIHP